MIFPYPALRKDTVVYRFGRGGRLWYEAENRTGVRMLISQRIADLLLKLEGGHVNPYGLPEFSSCTEEETDQVLLRLIRSGLLKKHGRINRHKGPFFLVSLLPVCLRRTRAVCWSTLFLLAALPVAFVASLLLLPDRLMYLGCGTFSEAAVIALGMVILLIGCFLHELGHGISAAATGGTTAEMGLLTVLCVPVGFYLAYMEAPNSTRFSRFAVAVSGVSMNALLACLCLLLCGCTGALDEVLLLGGIYNLLLVIFNLLPSSLLDGGAVLEALTGISNIHRRAMLFLLSKEERQSIAQGAGRPGSVIGAYLIAGAGQIAALLWSAASVLCLFR